MKRQRSLSIVCLILTAALMAACAEQTASGGVDTSTPPATGDSIVTLANEGQTIMLHAGERFLLKLGEDYDWTVTPVDSRIVSRVVNVLTVRGSQGLYEAHRAGRTTLAATGDPVCRNAQPACAAPSREFRIEVDVN